MGQGLLRTTKTLYQDGMQEPPRKGLFPSLEGGSEPGVFCSPSFNQFYEKF